MAVYSFILDSMEMKPNITRKLRRRPNDPVPIPDKRRKPPPDILNMREHMHWKQGLIFYASVPLYLIPWSPFLVLVKLFGTKNNGMHAL